MRKRKLLFTATILSMFLSFTTAYAAVYGGKWTTNPTYYADSSNIYASQIQSAVSTWNSTLSSIGASIRINTSSITSADIIPESSYFGATEWNAMGKPGPDMYSGSYEYADLKFNISYMKDYTSTKNKAIATHEWGHILGLNHTADDSISSLMCWRGSSTYYDQWNLTSPTSYDISQLNTIY